MKSLGSLKVAIIGGGFSGLATAAELAKVGSSVSIFDILPPGKAPASSAAGGIMHPLAPRGNYIWKGEESYAASKELFQLTFDVTKTKFWNDQMQLIRPLYSQEELSKWVNIMEKQNQKWIEILDESEFAKLTGVTFGQEGIVSAARIKNAIIIDAERYLSLLWDTIQTLNPNASWKIGPVNSVESLAREHDVVVIAAGAGIPSLWSPNSDHKLHIKYVKGHNIIYDNEKVTSMGESREPLTHALLSGQYIVPKTFQNQPTLLCGATHDHLELVDNEHVLQAMTAVPSIEEAEAALQEKLKKLYPTLHQLKPVGVNAGIRLVTERTNLGKIPIVGKHPTLSNVWVLGGLGARGLVYHGLMAKYLSAAIQQNDENLIPHPLHPKSHYLIPN